MILEYSQYIEASDWEARTTMRDYPKARSEIFYARRGWCPFCKTVAMKVLSESDSKFAAPSDWSSEWSYWVNAWACSTCGWWEVQFHHTYLDSEDDTVYSSVLRHAILRSFDPKDTRLPVEALRAYLKRRGDCIHQIHPRKMELLVQSVFSDFYTCDVQHCGGTRDGGVDLIIVNSDKPAVVQVKRRAKPGSVESVTTVREFLGAMLLRGDRTGYIVSTADHFSMPAKSAAARAITLGLVDIMELVDLRRLLDLVGVVESSDINYWHKYVARMFEEHSMRSCASSMNARICEPRLT